MIIAVFGRREITIAEALRQSGYNTALIGKWHLGHGEPQFSPLKHGFEYFYGVNGGCVDYFTLRYGNSSDWVRDGKPLEERGYATDLLSDDAVRFLKKQQASQPFFSLFGLQRAALRQRLGQETKQFTNILQAKPEDKERASGISNPTRREYAAMVMAMDQGIGRVLDTLRTQQLEENTVVVFTSDNGGDPNYGGDNKPFRGAKNEAFEGGIRVPCLIRWPRKIQPGIRTKQPACAIDFFPTFCSLAKVPTNQLDLDGIDLAPVMLEGKQTQRDFCWTLTKATAFRRGPWKYVRTGKSEMLFNLNADPYEHTDLAEAEQGRLEELRSAYQKIFS